MDNQRLRNLTTKRLHTETSHIYQDLAELIGIQLPSTCILSQVNNAVTPWLKEHVTDPRFWEDKYDTTHIGEYELPKPTDDDRKAMRERLKEHPAFNTNITITLTGHQPTIQRRHYVLNL